MGRRALALCALLTLAGCGGDDPPPEPEEAVRAAADAYVDALRDARWDDACERMTPAARAAVAEGSRSCAAALGAGGALPGAVLDAVARQLAGAPVRLTGARATLGPVGDLPEPLKFERRDGRWLLAP